MSEVAVVLATLGALVLVGSAVAAVPWGVAPVSPIEQRPPCTCNLANVDRLTYPDECDFHGGAGSKGRCGYCGEWAWENHPCFHRPWYVRVLWWLINRLDPV